MDNLTIIALFAIPVAAAAGFLFGMAYANSHQTAAATVAATLTNGLNVVQQQTKAASVTAAQEFAALQTLAQAGHLTADQLTQAAVAVATAAFTQPKSN